jgi:hypothetical protein
VIRRHLDVLALRDVLGDFLGPVRKVDEVAFLVGLERLATYFDGAHAVLLLVDVGDAVTGGQSHD